MWGFNGTARVLIEYRERAGNEGLLREPVDVRKTGTDSSMPPFETGAFRTIPYHTPRRYHNLK
jgi:hypothetical protein